MTPTPALRAAAEAFLAVYDDRLIPTRYLTETPKLNAWAGEMFQRAEALRSALAAEPEEAKVERVEARLRTVTKGHAVWDTDEGHRIEVFGDLTSGVNPVLERPLPPKVPDIVERLRAFASEVPEATDSPLLREAAAEIERLRSARPKGGG